MRCTQCPDMIRVLLFLLAGSASVLWLAMRADAEPITPARPPPDPDLAHEDDQPAEAGQGEFDWAA